MMCVCDYEIKPTLYENLIEENGVYILTVG